MYSERDIRESLRDFCCAESGFMWQHSLLAPRVETAFTAGPGAFWMTFLKGFRVRRAFMFFRRDEVLYECPFCRACWVLPLGYRDHALGAEGRSLLTAIGGGAIKESRLPRSLFLRALADTKRRCAHWPPED